MGTKFDAVFACVADVFAGSKPIEKIQPAPQGKFKALDPGDYRLVVKVAAKAKLKLNMPASMDFTENFEVSWKVVVSDDGSLSFEDRKTGKRNYAYLVGGMKLDTFEASGSKAQVGVEIEIEGETQRRDFELTLKGNPSPSKAPKRVLVYPKTLAVGSFPTDIAEVKKIKVKPAGYADWAGLRKFYDDLPALTRQRIENGEKPGGKAIEIVGCADDTGNAADNSKLGEKRAKDVMNWFKTWSGNKSESIYLTKGKGSGTASKGKPDPRQRMVSVLVFCEEER